MHKILSLKRFFIIFLKNITTDCFFPSFAKPSIILFWMPIRMNVLKDLEKSQFEIVAQFKDC